MKPYWSYEDVGAFFFVLVFVDAVVRLAARAHVLRSSELAAFGLPLQSLIILLLGYRRTQLWFRLVSRTNQCSCLHACGM